MSFVLSNQPEDRKVRHMSSGITFLVVLNLFLTITLVSFSIYCLRIRPTKTKTLEQFVGKLKQHDCKSVTAIIDKDDKYISGDIFAKHKISVSFILVAKTRRGSFILYKELISETLVVVHDIHGGDYSAVNEAKLRAIVTAGLRLSIVHEEIPGIRCELIVDNNKASAGVVEKYINSAVAAGISPSPTPA